MGRLLPEGGLFSFRLLQPSISTLLITVVVIFL